MAKGIQILAISLFFVSCKTIIPPPETAATEPSETYKLQIENIENGIYFRGVGNEPDWNLKISEKTIEFTSLKPGYESLVGNQTEPILAMDANVKMYKVPTNGALMTIQIMQQRCTNTMSGQQFLYSVRIDIDKNGNAVHLSGCGNYVTDYRLHDIWVLEKINGENVNATDFSKQLPNLEINSNANTFAGFAGCNRMGGSIFFERGLLRFTNLATTEMACGKTNKETIFLQSLLSTTKYKIENLRLIVTNPSGAALVFKKVD